MNLSRLGASPGYYNDEGTVRPILTLEKYSEGVTAISRWLSEATPPVAKT